MEATTSQPRQALAIANQTRLRGAALRHRLQAGRVCFAEAIRDPAAASETVERMLRWQAGWGSHRVRVATVRAGISPFKRVRDLTDRQVSILIAVVEGIGPGRT